MQIDAKYCNFMHFSCKILQKYAKICIFMHFHALLCNFNFNTSFTYATFGGLDHGCDKAQSVCHLADAERAHASQAFAADAVAGARAGNARLNAASYNGVSARPEN